MKKTRIFSFGFACLTVGMIGILGWRTSLEELETKESEAAELLAPYEHFDAVRSYPDVAMDFAAYDEAIQAARAATAKTSGTTGFSNVPWRLEGPTNIGGRINAIAIDPNNANTILVGCAVGGIFKTTDAGATWAPIFDAQPYLAIGDITFEPGSSNVIYAGTGDPNVGGYPFIGDGVYKSTDAGNTWTHLGLSNTRIVSRIIVDPVDHNRIFVSTMGLPMARDNNRGVYLSTNGGTTWTQSLFVTNQTGICDMVMDPVFHLVMYATSWDRIRTNQESTVDGPNAKVWKTTNGGTSWTALSGGLPTWDQSRVNIARHPSNSNILYASYVDTTLDLQGIYRTQNAGSTWTPVDISGLDPNALGGFGWYFGNVFVNPYAPNDLYLLGIQLWRTSNNGGTWDRVDPDWWVYDVHADKHDMVFTGPTSFYLATDGGLYHTTNNGQTWSDIDNIPNSQIYRVAVNPHAPQTYTGGLQDNGTTSGSFLDPNGWPRIYGGDGFQPIYDSNPFNIVVETQNGYVTFSDDGGNMFTNFDVGHDYNDRRNWDMPVIKSHFSDDTYYEGTFRVYTNTGGFQFQSWNPISGDLTDGVVFAERFHTITSIAESPLSAQVLFVGTSDGNVHYTDNTGNTWHNISAGIPDRYVTSVKASPFSITEALVTVSGYKYNDYVPHLMHTTDFGNTWQDVTGDLPPLALNDVLFHPTNANVWVVASDGGVYATLDAGAHWERVGTGMPMCPVYDMEWDEPGLRLVAGTHGRSIMTFPLDSIAPLVPVAVNQPLPAMQVQLYPNPAHDWVALHCSAASTAWQLRDASGRMVQQGNFEGQTKIDVRGLAAGVYFVRLASEEGKAVRRLVVE